MARRIRVRVPHPLARDQGPEGQAWRGHKNELARRRYAVNPHARRAGNSKSLLKQRYGITIEQKNELFASQGGACAICRIQSPSSATGWHVDHCHATKAIRGVPCQRCNNMLGNACDQPDVLRAAATYLEAAK